MKGRNPSRPGEMNEDTKNFSALVLRQRLMPEEQLEECLAYQESMSAHGLEKPVWVIALEKGYLKQENYREVVQSVRWIGIRQEDRRFGETAARLGYLKLPDAESALYAQEQAYQGSRKIRRVKDVLAERGLLGADKAAAVEAAMKSADLPPAQKPALESTPTLDEDGVVPVEQVKTMDDLIFPAETPAHAGAPARVEAPAPREEGIPALPDLDDSDTLGPRGPVDPDSPTVVRKITPAAQPPPLPREEVTDVGKVKSGDSGEEPTVVGKIAADSGRADAKVRSAGKTRTLSKKTAEPPPPPSPEPEDDPEKTVVVEKSPESADGAGVEPEEKKTRTLSRTGPRSGKTGRKKKGDDADAVEAPAAAAPKKGPPVVLIAGAAGGFGCLLLVVLLVVLVVLPMLSGGGDSGGNDSSSQPAANEDDASSEEPKDPLEKQPPPDDSASKKQPDVPDKPDTPPDRSGPMFEEAVSKRESGRFAEAAAILDELVSKHPDTEAGRKAAELVKTVKDEDECARAVAEGAQAIENGDLAAAQSCLERAARLKVLADRVSGLSAAVSSEKEFASLVERGQSLMASSKFAEAAESFAKALEIFDRPQARKLRAESRAGDLAERAGRSASAGKIEEAVDLLEEAKSALESESVDVPDKLVSSLADLRARAGKKARAALVPRVKELIRKGDKAAAAAEIEEHIRKYGGDKELDDLLASAKPKPVQPVQPVRPDPASSNGGTGGESGSLNSADGSVMILIPAGEFTMGSSGGDKDQQPQRKINLSAFRISRHEITNAQFARFIEANGSDRDAARNRLVYESSIGLKKSGGNWVPVSGFESHPVVGVTWFGARAYCQWAGGDLPTEAQWEKAARGEKGVKYPWGNDRPGQNHAVFGPSASRPEKVGSRPAGASPYGVLDMAGNVWEWCRDAYAQDFYSKAPDSDPFNDGASSLKRVLRGGSYRFSERFLDPCNRIAHPSSDSSDYFGFRLVIQG